MANTDRYIIMIVIASAAWGEGEGQNPEPDKVKEFVKYLDQYNVKPLIYLVDPAFKNPHPTDQIRFNNYPDNVIVVANTIENFYHNNQYLKESDYPIAYIMPFSLGPGTIVSHEDDIYNPNRVYDVETGQKQFDPFDIIIMGKYDPINNKFNRNIYKWQEGGKLPLKYSEKDNKEIVDLTRYDAYNLFYDILRELNCTEAFLYGKNYCRPNISFTNRLLLLQPFIRDNFFHYYKYFNGMEDLTPQIIENIIIDI